MSEQKELEKLQAMRAELEAESRLLIEEQRKLENSVLGLEEKVVIEKLNREKAIIEDLKNRNKEAKDAISQLEAKKKDLESRLGQTIQEPETPSEKKKTEKAPEPAEAEPEEDEEGGVTVTAIEDEALIENQEAVDEGSTKQEKKKRRFF